MAGLIERLSCAVSACLSSAALFACASTSVSPVAVPQETAPDAAGEGSPNRPAPDGETIAGQWDIVRFAGHEPRRLQGTTRAAFADFGRNGVSLRIECNYSGATGRVVSGRFVATPGNHVQTEMGCGRERKARDSALFGFFDRNPSVAWVGDDRLRLVSGTDELLLERPQRRRLAFLPRPDALMGEWKLEEITRYHPGGGYSGIGLSEIAGHVAIDGMSVRYSGCPALGLAYRYTADGRIEKTGGTALPPRAAGCEVLRGEDFGRNMPVPWDVLRVLHGNPQAEQVDAETLLLSTEEFGVLLKRVA